MENKFKKVVYLDKENNIVREPKETEKAKLKAIEIDKFMFPLDKESQSPFALISSMDIAKVGYMPKYALEDESLKSEIKTDANYWFEKFSLIPLEVVNLGAENAKLKGQCIMYPQKNKNEELQLNPTTFVIVFCASTELSKAFIANHIRNLQERIGKEVEANKIEIPMPIGTISLKSYSASNLLKALRKANTQQYDEFYQPIPQQRFSLKSKTYTEKPANGEKPKAFDFEIVTIPKDKQESVELLHEWAEANKEKFVSIEILAEFLSHWEYNGGVNHIWVKKWLANATEEQKNLLAQKIGRRRFALGYPMLNFETGEIMGEYTITHIDAMSRFGLLSVEKQGGDALYVESSEAQLALEEALPY